MSTRHSWSPRAPWGLPTPALPPRPHARRAADHPQRHAHRIHLALLSIIGSETIASLAGLGHRIVHLAEGMEIARMFAYIVFVVAIAMILNTCVSVLEARGKRL